MGKLLWALGMRHARSSWHAQRCLSLFSQPLHLLPLQTSACVVPVPFLLCFSLLAWAMPVPSCIMLQPKKRLLLVAEGRLPAMPLSMLLSSTKKYFPPLFKATNSPYIFLGYMPLGSIFLSTLLQPLSRSSCSPAEPAGKCSGVRWGCGMEAQPSPPCPSVP